MHCMQGNARQGNLQTNYLIGKPELLERANTIQLSEAAFRKFVADLDEPAEVVPELVRLFNRHSQIPTG